MKHKGHHILSEIDVHGYNQVKIYEGFKRSFTDVYAMQRLTEKYKEKFKEFMQNFLDSYEGNYSFIMGRHGMSEEDRVLYHVTCGSASAPVSANPAGSTAQNIDELVAEKVAQILEGKTKDERIKELEAKEAKFESSAERFSYALQMLVTNMLGSTMMPGTNMNGLPAGGINMGGDVHVKDVESNGETQLSDEQLNELEQAYVILIDKLGRETILKLAVKLKTMSPNDPTIGIVKNFANG